MNFTCANLRNKKCVIKVSGGDGTSSLNKLYLNDEELHYDKIRFVECSLSKEHVNVVILLSQEYKKKKELFLEYSWLQHNKKMEDEERVEVANEECCVLFDKLPSFLKVADEESFEGRFDGTYDMGKVYNAGDYLLCPTTKKILDLNTVDAVYFERMSSYQKNFDITFCYGENSTTSIFTVNRKKYYKVVQGMLEKKEVYEGGPDPLPMPGMLKVKKEQKLTWKQLSDMFLGSEDQEADDGSSDWSEGSEEEDDEEDDDAEFDNLVEEEEEEIEGEVSESESEDEDEEDEEFDEKEDEEDFGVLLNNTVSIPSPIAKVIDEMNTVENNKRKYDSDSTDESQPKRVKL